MINNLILPGTVAYVRFVYRTFYREIGGGGKREDADSGIYVITLIDKEIYHKLNLKRNSEL